MQHTEMFFCVVFPAETSTVEFLSLFPVENLVFRDCRSFWLALAVKFCAFTSKHA